MRLLSAARPQHSGKYVPAITLGFAASAWALSPTPAKAQMPKIIVQCIAPLVPNADGSDCVRPARSKTCREPTVLHNGRCLEPKRYVRFDGCKHRGGGGFRIAIFPRRHADHMWISGGGSRQQGGRDLKKGAFDAIYRSAKRPKSKRYCRSVRG